MTAREEAHRLLDGLPEDRLADTIELLREWAEASARTAFPHNRFLRR